MPGQEVFVYFEVSIFDLSNRSYESQIDNSYVSDAPSSQLSQMRKRSGDAGGVEIVESLETQYSRANKMSWRPSVSIPRIRDIQGWNQAFVRRGDDGVGKG